MLLKDPFGSNFRRKVSDLRNKHRALFVKYVQEVTQAIECYFRGFYYWYLVCNQQRVGNAKTNKSNDENRHFGVLVTPLELACKLSYFVCFTRKKNVCVKPFRIVFTYPTFFSIIRVPREPKEIRDVCAKALLE